MLGDMNAASTTTTPRPVGPVVPRQLAWYRFALLAAFVVVAIGLVTQGVRPASFSELTSGLVSGRVTQVTVVNELPPGSRGTALAEIRWNDGLLPRYTPVRHEVPDDVGGQPSPTVGSSEHTITGSIEEHLRQYTNADLQVTHAGEQDGTTWYLLGWRVPAWATILALFATLMTLGLLIAGPQPLLATRWAWFWVISSVVSFVAIPVFLLWGLPRTGEVERPYTTQGRLTGGRAFLIFCVLLASLAPGLRPGG